MWSLPPRARTAPAATSSSPSRSGTSPQGETTVRALYCTQTRTVSQDCGKVSAARRPVHGADRVARFLLGPLTKHPEATVEPTATDDGLGFRITEHGKLDSVMVLGVRGERVTEVWLVRNPEKLTRWR